jgi:hypothetical protein
MNRSSNRLLPTLSTISIRTEVNQDIPTNADRLTTNTCMLSDLEWNYVMRAR